MEIVFKGGQFNEFTELNFKIESEYITGITGSGKTEILKLIDCIDYPKGSIYYDDVKLTKKNVNSIRRQVSLVEQEFKTQIFLKTVREHMLFIMKYYRLKINFPEKKMTDSLKIVGLESEYLDKEIDSLSASEKKLIQIAVSLLTNPDIILLDEPFINLDKKNEKLILILINKLKENYKKTIVIASHDSDMLYKYTKKMIFIKNNKVFLTGDTKEVYKRVDYLTKNKFEIPDIVRFTYKVIKEKNVNIDYHRDIRDLIKDIYKHV